MGSSQDGGRALATVAQCLETPIQASWSELEASEKIAVSTFRFKKYRKQRDPASEQHVLRLSPVPCLAEA